ncbi:hypothetical protein AN958_07361 [Leucoagaricus sp. SymC.cos]|nr:hypothetical protein AN958_07361 [Leucoagaricus sp. SymC.cos]
MPAEEFYSRPTICLDKLPDELLGEVLRHATWVPYGIHPSDLVASRMQSSEAVENQKDYIHSLVTKRYLIRVCKRWHRLAFLYLYEWVLVSRLKNLKGLITAVERRLFDDPERASVGRVTRRLEIDFRWTGREGVDELRQINILLPSLLQSLVELEILVIGDCFEVQWMNPWVSHTLCPKVRYLNWVAPQVRPIFKHWINFLQSHPNLIGINPPEGMSLNRITPIQLSHPQITAWTTTSTDPVVPKVFPSLRRLSVVFHFGKLDERWGERLITQPLLSLEILQLNVFYPTHKLTVDTMLETIQPLYRFMPHLRRVELVLLSWNAPETWSRYAPPASVSVLGVRVRSTRPKKQAVKHLLQILRGIVQSTPRLKIQFTDEGTLRPILKEEEYLVRCAKEGKIIERWLDHEGCEYRLPVE